MIITSDDYVAYLNRAAAVIRDSKDYISDAATGDGITGQTLIWVLGDHSGRGKIKETSNR